jgi:hypothetical protein
VTAFVSDENLGDAPIWWNIVFTKKLHVLNDRLALETILSWVIFPAAAFEAAWVLATLRH